MNFDFNGASHEAQHIARFMDMAQDCLQEIQPVPEGKEDYLESLYSLVLISERIAKGLMKRLDDGERDVMSPAS